MNFLKLQTGSTILEVLIAATLIATAIIAALSLSTNTQKQTDFSRALNQATVHNNQALDWIRNMRSQMGWASFVGELASDAGVGSTVIYCLNTLVPTTVEFAALISGECESTNVIPGTSLQREMIITLSDTPISRTQIIANTYWAAKAHRATTETVLADR